MKEFRYYALRCGLAAALLQGCLEAPNPVDERREPMAASILASGQDLMITNVAFTTVTPADINYSFTIKNVGTEAVADLYDVTIQAYYSANAVLGDADDEGAGGTELHVSRSLAAGASYTGSFNIPRIPPAGKHWVIFKIDAHNIVAEKREDNNTFVVMALPDLQFTSFAITSRTSSRVHYSYTIRNNGKFPILSLNDVVIQNFYSANTIFNDAGDVAAGGTKLLVSQPLLVGASYSGTFYSTGAVPAGKPYLTTKIDYSGSVAESNENNNTVAKLIP